MTTTQTPYVGQPATIHLFSDSRAAVVTKVNKKSIIVAAVETGPETRDERRDGPYPVMVAEGILDKIVGQPERFAIVETPRGTRYGAGSIRVSLGRSVSITDYRY
jgi:hypothetical protein